MASPFPASIDPASVASASSRSTRAIRRSKRDAPAVRRMANRRALNDQHQAHRPQQQVEQPDIDYSFDAQFDEADHTFEANFDEAFATNEVHTANHIITSRNTNTNNSHSSPVKPTESIDQTADLTNNSSSSSSLMNQSSTVHLGALNISPVKKTKSFSPSSSSSAKYNSHDSSGYNFDASPDRRSDTTGSRYPVDPAAAIAPLSRSPVRSPTSSPNKPPSSTRKAQPMTPGTAAATYALNSQERKKSSPGGSPHIIQTVGSDLTDDDAHGSPYRHATDASGEMGAIKKSPTTPGRRSSTSNSHSAKSSPRTPARGSPSRTPNGTPPRPPSSTAQTQTQSRSSPPRQLYSPPKRGVIPLHEAQAAVRAAASAINGTFGNASFPYAPQTAMNSSFDRNIYGPGDTTARDDGSADNGDDANNPLDTSFESIVREFTLDSSYVMEDDEYELVVEEGTAPDDEILIDDGLDDLEVFAAKAKAKARARAKAESSSPKGRDADSCGEWVSFEEEDGSSDAFGTPHSGMDDDYNVVGGERVWPPPQTPTRSPPSSAGKANETSPDRSNGESTNGDDSDPLDTSVESVSTGGTKRTNNRTPSRPNNLVVSTPRRSPPRGIVTPSRIGAGVSPGRLAAGVSLMDDDNTTIRTDDESYKYMTPQRAVAQYGVKVVPGTPVKPGTPLGLSSPSAGTPDTERDISFESNNELNTTVGTVDTIQANNTTMSMMANAAELNLSYESDALQTVDDKSPGTRVSADSEDKSIVQEYNTKTGSKVIPGRSGHDDKEACGILREFEEFLEFGLYELVDDLADTVKDFGKTMCAGGKHLRWGEGDDTSQDSSRCSSRMDRRKQRLNRIMSTQRLRRISSNRSTATADSSDSRQLAARVPSRTGHQVKESFAC